MGLTRRFVLGAAASAPIAAVAGTSVAAEPVLVTLTHADGRATRYRLMTPSGRGRWPVVLFSHGANSSSALYDRLWRVWAARGYAVIGPDHIDTGPPATHAKTPANGLWQSRLDDMTLLLRSPQALNRAAAERGGRLDWTRIGATGHSFGAVVAQALAGGRLTDMVSHAPSGKREPTVKACLAFSPPGPLSGFIPPDAWTPVEVPSFLQTGDADILPGFVDDWRSRLIGFAGAADRWSFVGHGVNHYFGGLICRLSPDAGAQSAALDEAGRLSCDMLDAYVKQDARALAALKTRARLGDDGVAIFADASGAPLADAMPGAGAVRRTLVAAALSAPLWSGLTPGTARAQNTAAPAPAPAPVPAAPPTFAPSATVRIRGATRPAPFLQGDVAHLLDPKALTDAQAYSDSLGGAALLVSVGGRLVHERYAPGVSATTPLKTYSMAKSVMGLVFGLAIARKIVTLQDPIGRHIVELRGDPRGDITLLQLLQMRSGLKLDSLGRREPKAIALMVGQHVTETALTTPLVGTPGAQFEYANVNSFLAGLALDRALGKAGKGRYTDYLSRDVWQPLGQSDATLEVENIVSGEPRFFAGLDACGRDWLRIGSLFVDPRQRVVPAAWIKTMTTPSPNPVYGLQMWIGRPWTPERRYGPNTPSVVPSKEPYVADDLVFFDGAGGQRVYMVPSKQIVIVRTGAASTAWDDSIVPNAILRGLR